VRNLVVMLLDQASRQTTQQLEVPEIIRLPSLPPGSPELNPAEHIWEDQRGNKIANQLPTPNGYPSDFHC
jgi:transposase